VLSKQIFTAITARHSKGHDENTCGLHDNGVDPKPAHLEQKKPRKVTLLSPAFAWTASRRESIK
jgi:hypothetical protein